MTEPTQERTAEEKAAIERGGKKWAIGFGVVLVAAVAFIATRNMHTTPTPEDRQADAKRACQEKFIPDRLKAPATAQFSSVTVSGFSGTYTVSGAVDSQNAFGALVRASFTCSVHLDGDQWVLDNAAVNG
jgi:hypothetical protein